MDIIVGKLLKVDFADQLLLIFGAQDLHAAELHSGNVAILNVGLGVSAVAALNLLLHGYDERMIELRSLRRGRQGQMSAWLGVSIGNTDGRTSEA